MSHTNKKRHFLSNYLALLTMAALSFCLTSTTFAASYSIIYDDNVVSNMPTDVSDKTYGTTVSVTSTIPTRSGFHSIGWCSVIPTYINGTDTCTGGTQYSASDDLAINQTSSSNNYHLYAMWKEGVDYCMGSSYDCLQEVTTATCPTTAKDVIDGRDGNIYKVQKLADNKCWMLDNLRLDPTAVDLATLKGKTNASDQTLTYLKNGGGSSPYNTTAVANVTSGFNQYTQAQVNVNFKDDTITSFGSGSGKIGVYYNYCAASAGSYCYSSSSSSGNASEDICPAGWRMPTGGNGSGEYHSLYYAYPAATDFRNALSTPISGRFYDSSQSQLDMYGTFWASTRSDNAKMYDAFVSDGSYGVSMQDTSGRDRGYSVRCVAK